MIWNSIYTILNSPIGIIVCSGHCSHSCLSIKSHTNNRVYMILILWSCCRMCLLFVDFFFFVFISLGRFSLFNFFLRFLLLGFLFRSSEHDNKEISFFNSQCLYSFVISCIFSFIYYFLCIWFYIFLFFDDIFDLLNLNERENTVEED